jgi:hypothetical protein
MFRLLAHAGIPGWAPVAAFGLFFVGIGAAVLAYWYSHTRPGREGRIVGVLLGVVGVACLALGTAVPLIVHATPNPARPSTTARLSFVTPSPGEHFEGNPASVRVYLDLHGGTIVPIRSLHLVPNEGHIHLYLDGRLVSMTGTETAIQVAPGSHTLVAEFVAVDHGPFHPRVTTSVGLVVDG